MRVPDDGLIHISQDDGGSWRSIEVGSLPGVPDRAFVNDIRADLHDADTVYLALDNHKYGDFSPYLLVSKNRGRSWKKITNGIPDRHLVWRLVQDHVRPELMFAATEFGVFATFDAGKAWHKLSGGMPTYLDSRHSDTATRKRLSGRKLRSRLLCHG
jgi:hypothetical protein